MSIAQTEENILNITPSEVSTYLVFSGTFALGHNSETEETLATSLTQHNLLQLT